MPGIINNRPAGVSVDVPLVEFDEEELDDEDDGDAEPDEPLPLLDPVLGEVALCVAGLPEGAKPPLALDCCFSALDN
jgi:hypothetical protein